MATLQFTFVFDDLEYMSISTHSPKNVLISELATIRKSSVLYPCEALASASQS